jgi:hypothetical protein
MKLLIACLQAFYDDDLICCQVVSPEEADYNGGEGDEGEEGEQPQQEDAEAVTTTEANGEEAGERDVGAR